jgi:hypothetical protein
LRAAGSLATSGRVEQRSWWGRWTIPVGKSGRWRIGPLSLLVSRLPNEWRVCRASSGSSSDSELSADVPTDVSELGAGTLVARYASSDSSENVELEPVMPDRSVVTRPEHPITVVARAAVTLYVGSPLWVRISAGSPARVLGDFPAFQPQLTWWGPSTILGESCYATRTYGRLRLEEARPGPHRVMTAVRIVNRSADPLVIERLNLPVRMLSVHAANGSSRLWTEAVTLERGEHEAFAELALEEDPGPDVAGAARIGAAREPFHENPLFRAFGKLFR